MKYLFLINSHATYLTAKQAISYFQLDKSDCVYCLERNYSVRDNEIQAIEFPFQVSPQDSFRANLLPHVLWKKIDQLDSFITKVTSDCVFKLFCAQSSIIYFYLLMTHPKCVSYSFIEGGIGAYKPEYQKKVSKKKNWIKSLWYFLIYKGRVPVQKFFFNTNLSKFEYCLGLTEYSFKGFKNAVNVGGKLDDRLSKELNIKHLFVLDAMVEFYNVKIETIEEMVLELSQYFVRMGVKEFHYKLHPEHYKTQEIKNKYIQLLNEKSGEVRAIELGKDVVLEEIAYNSEDTIFYVNVSSIGLYANIWGREVWSFAKFVHKKELQIDFEYKELGPKKVNYF